jgi:hypothetical protein
VILSDNQIWCHRGDGASADNGTRNARTPCQERDPAVVLNV